MNRRSGIRGADEDKHRIGFHGRVGVRGHTQYALTLQGDHIAVGLFTDAAVTQGQAHKGRGRRHPENVQSFRQNGYPTGTEQIDDRTRRHRSVRHHQIRPGVVQGGHVAIERGTAEDLHVRPQLAAIDGQIDVQVIVMRGHDDGRGFHDVRPLEHRQFPGIPENVTGIVRRHEPGVLLDETERQPATFQGIRRSFPHLAAAEDKHGRPVRLAAPLGLAVISLKLIRRPREQQDGGLVDPAVRARGHIGIALPQPGHVEAEAFRGTRTRAASAP